MEVGIAQPEGLRDVRIWSNPFWKPGAWEVGRRPGVWYVMQVGQFCTGSVMSWSRSCTMYQAWAFYEQQCVIQQACDSTCTCNVSGVATPLVTVMQGTCSCIGLHRTIASDQPPSACISDGPHWADMQGCLSNMPVPKGAPT